jgi:hypothetical protein
MILAPGVTQHSVAPLTTSSPPCPALQIKRIHEYKRQYMNVLSIIWRYKQLKKMTPEERKKQVPRVCVIGGKAASAYDMAKRIIHLINAVGTCLGCWPVSMHCAMHAMLLSHYPAVFIWLIPEAQETMAAGNLLPSQMMATYQ